MPSRRTRHWRGTAVARGERGAGLCSTGNWLTLQARAKCFVLAESDSFQDDVHKPIFRMKSLGRALAFAVFSCLAATALAEREEVVQETAPAPKRFSWTGLY